MPPPLFRNIQIPQENQAKNLPSLLLYGMIISLGIVGIWLVVGNFLGKKFNELQNPSKENNETSKE